MTKYLITGAAGFIGSNLVEALLQRGAEVVGVDNFLTGKRSNIAPFESQFQFMEGDLLDRPLIYELCQGVDYVLHHAALASVPWSMDDPLLAHNHNVTGTLNVLLAARDQNVKRVVTAVTSAAYGDSAQLPSTESQPALPKSPYAVTKLMDELYLKMFNDIYNLSTVGLRYFNVYGPRQDPTSAYAAAIPIFAQKILSNESPIIFGDGEQTRDFVFINDVVQANLKACTAGPEASGKVFNIGTGERVTVNALCKQMCTLLNPSVTPQYVPERVGDVKHSMADISLAKEFLDYTPSFDVARGLEAAIGWYRNNLSQ